jgi:hypothetical protein
MFTTFELHFQGSQHSLQICRLPIVEAGKRLSNVNNLCHVLWTSYLQVCELLLDKIPQIPRSICNKYAILERRFNVAFKPLREFLVDDAERLCGINSRLSDSGKARTKFRKSRRKDRSNMAMKLVNLVPSRVEQYNREFNNLIRPIEAAIIFTRSFNITNQVIVKGLNLGVAYALLFILLGVFFGLLGCFL